MTLLTIHLQEGFFEDAVVIEVNGDEVFHKDQVSTRFQIGLADTIELEVDTDSAVVAVKLPRKNSVDQVQVPLTAPAYVGVSVADGSIDFKHASEPFGYV